MMKSNIEAYLQAMINDTGTDGLPTPKSRIGKLLYVLCGKLGLIQQKVADVETVANTQSNWSQNDPNASDYVKGRTHYKETKLVDANGYGMAAQGLRSSTDGSIRQTARLTYSTKEVGDVYVYPLYNYYSSEHEKIAEYSGVVRERTASDSTQVAERYVGNAYLRGRSAHPGLEHDEIVALGFPDTGESFYRGEAYFIISDVSLVTDAQNMVGMYELKEEITAIHKLDEKYIPDTIQRVGSDVIVHSSTASSTKKFKLTVDDAGTITATEVTEE